MTREPVPPSTTEPLAGTLNLTARGAGAVEEIIAILRECDRATLALTERIKELEVLAMRDALTKLPNRHSFDEAMRREEARAARAGLPVAVVLLDVRGLKSVNDHHGHLAGDAVLQTLAAALLGSARGSDVVARFGGDEFGALLPGADHTGARQFIERVRRAAGSARLPDGETIPVSITDGSATREETGSMQAALALADQRLVEDKRHNGSSTH